MAREQTVDTAGQLARRRRRAFTAAATIALLLAGASTIPSTSTAATPPSGRVSHAPISATALLDGHQPSGLTHNRRFARPANAQTAPAFAGRLELAGSTMGVLSDAPGGGITNPAHGKDTTYFPDVSISFFTVGSRLVPTTQNVIRNGVLPRTRSYWDVIVQPGSVWTQPGDRGWHRASFPFALVNSIEGETHTGLALFLYRGTEVSHVRYQVVQQTSPFDVPEYFSAWGVTEARFVPGLPDVASLRRGFTRAQQARWPERRFVALREHGASPDTLEAFASYSDTIHSAVVVDRTVYRTHCPSAAGPIPYCGSIRYGVWSVTKSALLDAAMMRLAQKYGAGLVDRRVAPYLPGAWNAAGWRDVTFGDLANMASGHGPAGEPTCYLCDYTRWYVAPSAAKKTAEALDYPRFAEPGTRYNYRDQDAYLLMVAMTGLLKKEEGRDASIWRMLRREVYAPLGIHHAPSNLTVERRGPGMLVGAYGYYPTIDELAKISALYQAGGRWNGRQILSRELAQRLFPAERVVPPHSLPVTGDRAHRYLYDWHLMRMRPRPGCSRYVPQMEGWGGNTLTSLPDGVTLIRMRNNWVGDPSNPQVEINDLAAELSPICG